MASAFSEKHWNDLTDGLSAIKDTFVEELVSYYSSSKRHYHTLDHIETLLK